MSLLRKSSQIILGKDGLEQSRQQNTNNNSFEGIPTFVVNYAAVELQASPTLSTSSMLLNDPSSETSFGDSPVFIHQINEPDVLREFSCSDLYNKAAIANLRYNIIKNKTNLYEKRGPKFTCAECNYAMPTRLSMTTHMKMHLKPFCEVCFLVLDSSSIVKQHVQLEHPEVMQLPEASLSGIECKEYFNLQTVAPPNTPNATSDDEMITIEGLLNPLIQSPIPESGFQGGTESTGTEDECSVNAARGRSSSSRRTKKQKKGRIVRRKLTLMDKHMVKKRNPSRKIKKGTVVEVATVMKQITSRFGRAISLKMPQY